MLKIAIVGPENSGKSTLSKDLELILPQSVRRKEYARAYLREKGMPYSYKDLGIIAYHQHRSELYIENELIQKHPQDAVLICDTEFLVLKIWSEYVFGGVSPYVSSGYRKQKYDLYLLCKSDLPWENDGLREYPDENIRAYLFELYKQHLTESSSNYHVIEGDFRLEQALKAIHTQWPGVIAK